MKRILVLGGPGAGKTTRLLKVMEETLDRGIKPDRIAFCSFTRVASHEGRDRAMRKFGFKEEDLPHCRTLHSTCYRALNLKHTQVLQDKELKILLDHLHIDAKKVNLDPISEDMDTPLRHFEVHPIVAMDHLARTTKPFDYKIMAWLQKVYEEKSRRNRLDFSWDRLQQFSTSYTKYKEDRVLLDFTDMLSEYIEKGEPIDVDVAILDEVQDLTPLQWEVATKAFGQAGELWAGGDDDQSIYDWAGAAKDHLLSLGWPVENLVKSHRLPRAIFKSAKIFTGLIKERYDKKQEPADREGQADWKRELKYIPGMAEGQWLLLARTYWLAVPFATFLRDEGFLYYYHKQPSISEKHRRAIQGYLDLQADKPIDHLDALALFLALGQKPPRLEEGEYYGAGDLRIDLSREWPDALQFSGISRSQRIYYWKVYRRYKRLMEEPRIRVSTIHSAKGLECQNVVLSLDMGNTVHEGFRHTPDPEHRAFYVGATRASEKLYFLEPNSYPNSYPFHPRQIR